MLLKTAVFAVTAAIAAAQTITTFAGNGTAGTSGDSGQATQAQINRVVGIAADRQGNIYLAEENGHRVRKVDRNGIITTFAGNGSPGFSGDGLPATSAQLQNPTGVCTDPSGNLYINDNGNHRIRRVNTSGVIETVVGNGSAIPGDGPGTTVGASLPIRCATESGGNLFFVDQGGHRVRRVAGGGTVSPVAGNGTQGFSGDQGTATAAMLNNPTALAFSPNDELFVVDQFNHRIRKITQAGIISTVVYNGTQANTGEGVPALQASANFPGDIKFDRAGNLYIVESTANRIRKVDTSGIITTFAGTGAAGFAGDGGNALQAQFNAPFAIAIDPDGNMYIGDTSNNRVRKIAFAAASPVITSAGVTNAASFRTGIAPGGMVTIFGSGLGARSGEVITAPGSTWPTTLSGVNVTMEGIRAPIYNLVNLNGQEQLTVQAPFELSNRTNAAIVVTTAAGSSSSVTVPVSAAQPGIFPQVSPRAAITHANGSVVTLANPAIRGETVIIYMTGLGTVSNPPVSGQPAPTPSTADGLSRTTANPVVTVGDVTCPVSFSGLSPGYIGLYQINVALPATVPSGGPPLVVTMNGVSSNSVILDIR